MQNMDSGYVNDLYLKMINGDRLALSKAITLVESQKRDHEIYAQEVLEKCANGHGKSIRIGITGTPGVGKSTFIESLGQLFIEDGKKVAVLTIDPTSPMNSGSILGDKSRMNKLSHSKNAYVRTSPSRSKLGGTTDRSRETIILCESAGYDVILVETVGVGQSETEIMNMVDMLLLLVLPGSGDEIQGIKRGIVEIADVIVVNKEDRLEKNIVKDTLNTYKFALHLKSVKESGWTSTTYSCSALTGSGMTDLFQQINDFFQLVIENGYLESNRTEQHDVWLDQKVEELAIREIKIKTAESSDIQEIKSKVKSGKLGVYKAAQTIVSQILK